MWVSVEFDGGCLLDRYDTGIIFTSRSASNLEREKKG